MKNIVSVFGAIYLIFFSSSCFSIESVKIAIIDNFKYQKYVTTKYKDYYLEGLDHAVKAGKSRGLLLQYKIFQYDQDPLSIIKVLPDLLAWKPDVVIGPRDSNKFLILSSYIRDTLTLSPFATSMAVNKMPGNFFGIALPDVYEAKAMNDFIQWKFPERDVILVTEADCRSCRDVSSEFVKTWDNRKQTKPYQEFFLSQQGSTVKLEGIMKNNPDGKKIVVMPDNAHDSSVLMARISRLYSTETIFIGGDGWGSWKDTEVGKLGNLMQYSAYHIVPWGLDKCTNKTKILKEYYEHAGSSPKNKLSLIIYQTVMSVVSAYDQHGRALKGEMKIKLLQAYKEALEKDKYWYKPVEYRCVK